MRKTLKLTLKGVMPLLSLSLLSLCLLSLSQLVFICSKSTIKTTEQYVKSVRS